MHIRIPKLTSGHYDKLPPDGKKCPDNIIKFTKIFFNSCKFRNVIDIKQIESAYTSYLSNKDYLVSDGLKVVGWIMSGHFHNYSEVYDI